MLDIHLGDCLTESLRVPDGSVDLVLTDLPYGTIKGLDLDSWSDETTTWDEVVPISDFMAAANRVLRPNGTMALFAQQPFTTSLINRAAPSVPFVYSLVWEKHHFGNPLSAKKAPVKYHEDILIFNKKSPKHDYSMSHPLRDYFGKVYDFIGLSKSDIIQFLGGKADHVFRVNSTQFSLCTEETYSDLIRFFDIADMPDFKDFKTLIAVNAQYTSQNIESLTSEYPNTFNLPTGKKVKGSILKYKKDPEKYHPTQKPVALLRDIIETYSNPGDTVMDFTMGSGSTLISCLETGRAGIGIEKDKTYFDIARNRLIEADVLNQLSI